jgi:hypothetical protein
VPCHAMPMVVLWSDVGARYTTLILIVILTTVLSSCTSVAASSKFKFSFQRSTCEHFGVQKGEFRDAFRNSTFLDSIGDPPCQ